VVNQGGRGVIGLIDVGSDGVLPEPWRDNAHLIRRVLGFEPLAETRVEGDITTVSAALWRTAEQRTFYIQQGSSHGDSLYPPNLDYVRERYDELRLRGDRRLAETWIERSTVASTKTLDTTTLDAVLAELPDRYNFLKIDAQGADFDILLGADRFLRADCVGVHLEAFTIPLYEGIALLGGIDEHMTGLGFHRVWTASPHGSFDSQCDCLFLCDDAADGVALKTVRQLYGISDPHYV